MIPGLLSLEWEEKSIEGPIVVVALRAKCEGGVDWKGRAREKAGFPALELCDWSTGSGRSDNKSVWVGNCVNVLRSSVLGRTN